MCISTGASFGMGTVLVITGIASVKEIKAPSQLLFASIPLLFSFQQFTEGFLWISLRNPEYALWQHAATYIFLFIAQSVWPVWVPLSMFFMEQNLKIKKILFYITGIGILVSVYSFYCLVMFPVHSSVSNHHIHYELQYPWYGIALTGFFYFIATVIPSFISAGGKLILMGILILLSFMVTKLFFNEYVVSVWCFLAALISIIIYRIMQKIPVNS
jgi:hypothetical protein